MSKTPSSLYNLKTNYHFGKIKKFGLNISINVVISTHPMIYIHCIILGMDIKKSYLLYMQYHDLFLKGQ